MKWKDIKPGTALEWTYRDSELYAILETHMRGETLVELRLLDLREGDVFWWVCPHPSDHDVKSASVRVLWEAP